MLSFIWRACHPWLCQAAFPAIRASICGANRLLVKHVSGLLPENLIRYISPVPVAARTVDGYQLGRAFFPLGPGTISRHPLHCIT